MHTHTRNHPPTHEIYINVYFFSPLYLELVHLLFLLLAAALRKFLLLANDLLPNFLPQPPRNPLCNLIEYLVIRNGASRGPCV